MNKLHWIAGLTQLMLPLLPMVAQTYSPQNYPATDLSNGVLQAKVYLPDAKNGFYRGTRFDWAGVMASLEYKGHSYFGPFFEKFDPSVSDVEIGDPIKAGINSAASGPVEEFIGADGTALGYSEAKPGKTFCKIGVGSLKKIDNAAYSSYTNYPIVDGGKRSAETGAESIEFTQEVHCGSGYGYYYRKTIRLYGREPLMAIEHELMNQGKKAIETRVYDHNFFRIDGEGAGPSLVMTLPFTPRATQDMGGLGEIHGKDLVFPKELRGSDTFYTELVGFGARADDYQITLENRKTGAGVLIRGDRPLQNLAVWAVRTVVAPEPYIDLRIPVGKHVYWTYIYSFYERPPRRTQ
jgi:hypothetical protein